jgi:peptide/nickel transport system substrate-binding protein
MEAVSATSLKLTLKVPSAVQLGNLALPRLQVLAPEVVEMTGGRLTTADTVVGTGAFVMQRSEVGVGSSLVCNPTYFKRGLPYLDRLEIRAFKDSAPRLLTLAPRPRGRVGSGDGNCYPGYAWAVTR